MGEVIDHPNKNTDDSSYKDPTMNGFRYTLAVSFGLTLLSWLAAPSVALAEDEPSLIAVLQSSASPAEKAITCKKLAIWGSEKSVPALAALLPDPELSSWARIPLEVIPGSAADKAFREALTKLEGRTLIGVINSIGVRKDPQAVAGLIKHLRGSDGGAAGAAAAALAQIGDGPSVAALRAALGDVPAVVRSEVADGCIRCAEGMLDKGQGAAALELYEQVRAADVPKQRIVEATRGAIMARGGDGVAPLIDLLRSSDPVMVSLALTTARELSGKGISKRLADALPGLAPERQALLILALADRGDREALPAVLAAAQKGPTQVRVAAIGVLEGLGDASCLPVLLPLAGDSEAAVAAAVLETLGALPGTDVDEKLVGRLATAKGAQRLAIIELIGRRRIDAVAPLLAALEDPNGQVRAVALEALGQVARLEHIDELIQRVVKPAHAEDGQVSIQALKEAAVRMPQREACAAKLSTALDDAPVAVREAILETLKDMGGPTALEAVGRMAVSKDARSQDTATRLLGEWMSADAGPVLLALAKNTNSSYQVRALRGYIRLPRQFGLQMSDQQRVDMCRKAWDAAARDAERELVLQVVERYPSMGMLRLAVAAAQNETLRPRATAVARAVARKVRDKAEAKELLKKLAD